MKKLLALMLAILMLGLCGCSKQPETQWYTEGDITITEQQAREIVNGDFVPPKNVILIIGDGMGPNDLILAEQYAEGCYDFGLVLNTIEHQGFVTTHSADNEATDSAASATALSTGRKTNNGYIAKDTDGSDLVTMTQRARAKGKKVGVITDDLISGATPSAFTVNNINRSNTTEIINSFIRFKPDLLIGKDYAFTYANIDLAGRDILEEEYVCAESFGDFNDALNSDAEKEKAFIGFTEGFSKKPSNTLANCAEVAFKRLENENGFFLMIESSGTDKYGHGSKVDIVGKVNSVITLDRTVAVALKYMKDHPDTLLIVTSDHETGGVRIPAAGEELSAALNVDDHTASPVKVFAVGYGAEYFSGKTVDNTDIAKFIIDIIEGK